MTSYWIDTKYKGKKEVDMIFRVESKETFNKI